MFSTLEVIVMNILTWLRQSIKDAQYQIFGRYLICRYVKIYLADNDTNANIFTYAYLQRILLLN